MVDSNKSEESVVADSKTSASNPPAIFDVNQLFKRTINSSSSSTSDVLSCKCVWCLFLTSHFATCEVTIIHFK